jgi:hypothetical protein
VRSSRKVIASAAVGFSAASIRKMLDGRYPADERAERPGERCAQAVAREQRRAVRGLHGPGEQRLFRRQEDADVAG